MLNDTLVDISKLEYFDIAPTDQLSNGERLFIEISGKSIVLLIWLENYLQSGTYVPTIMAQLGMEKSRTVKLFVRVTGHDLT